MQKLLNDVKNVFLSAAVESWLNFDIYTPLCRKNDVKNVFLSAAVESWLNFDIYTPLYRQKRPRQKGPSQKRPNTKHFANVRAGFHRI